MTDDEKQAIYEEERIRAQARVRFDAEHRLAKAERQWKQANPDLSARRVALILVLGALWLWFLFWFGVLRLGPNGDLVFQKPPHQ